MHIALSESQLSSVTPARQLPHRHGVCRALMAQPGGAKSCTAATHGHSELCMQGQLFAALRRTRLVEEGLGWQALQYSRCGRTDKGVSALGQARPLRRMLCERQCGATTSRKLYNT